jgi:hypothetical protein
LLGCILVKEEHMIFTVKVHYADILSENSPEIKIEAASSEEAQKKYISTLPNERICNIIFSECIEDYK